MQYYKDMDPWFGDIVQGPDGRQGRVCGTGSIPDQPSIVYVELPNQVTERWEERYVFIVVPNEVDVPLTWRKGRY